MQALHAQGGPERFTHRKTWINKCRRRMRKCFNTTIRSIFRTNLTDYISKWLTLALIIRSIRVVPEAQERRTTSSYNLAQAEWMAGCLQWVQIGVGTSWNITLQNGPDCEVHGIDIVPGEWPHLLVPKALETVLAPPLRHISCVSWRTILCEDEIIQWAKEKLCPAT